MPGTFWPALQQGCFSETGLPINGLLGNLALSYVVQRVLRDRQATQDYRHRRKGCLFCAFSAIQCVRGKILLPIPNSHNGRYAEHTAAKTVTFPTL